MRIARTRLVKLRCIESRLSRAINGCRYRYRADTLRSEHLRDKYRVGKNSNTRIASCIANVHRVPEGMSVEFKVDQRP